MSRKLAFAILGLAAAASVAQASPITAIRGYFVQSQQQGPQGLLMYDSRVTEGGALLGFDVKASLLSLAGFTTNPGLAPLLDANLMTPTFNFINADQSVGFGFSGPLELTTGPGQIRLTGDVQVLGDAVPGIDLSAFSDGGIFEMTFDPSIYSFTPGPDGGLVAIANGLGEAGISWSITTNQGGGGDGGGGATEVPEPMSLLLFGGVAIGGVWAARRRQARKA